MKLPSLILNEVAELDYVRIRKRTIYHIILIAALLYIDIVECSAVVADLDALRGLSKRRLPAA